MQKRPPGEKLCSGESGETIGHEEEQRDTKATTDSDGETSSESLEAFQERIGEELEKSLTSV